MTTTPTRFGGAPTRPRSAARRRRLQRYWPALVIGALAFLGRLIPVLNGGGMFGRHTYDPFVYYGAAVALSTGHLPYRDFLLLHPPGILIALLPFALLGGLIGDPLGMALARLAWMSLGAISAALIFVILRNRGWVAAGVGAALYAVWFPAFYVERDVRLEALGTVLLLLGLYAMERLQSRAHPVRWAVAAGVLAGFSVLVKVWGVVPLAVLLVWLLATHGLRIAVAALASALGTVALVMLPFALAGPKWLQLIVLDQVGRPRDGHSWQFLLQSVLGLGPVPAGAATACLVVGCLLAGVAIVLACRTSTGRLHAALAVVGGAFLLWVPTWYAHYPALVAAPLCLLFGEVTGAAVRAIGGRRLLRQGIVATIALVLMAAQAVLFTQSVGWRFPGADLAEVLDHRQGCVTTDRTAALVLTGSLRRNIARGCPIVVDILGCKFAGQAADTSAAATRERFERVLIDYLATGKSVILVHERPADFAPDLRRRIDSWQIVGGSGRYLVRQPR